MRYPLTLIVFFIISSALAQEKTDKLQARFGLGGELITVGFTSLDTRLNHGLKFRADLPLGKHFRLVPSFILYGEEPVFKEYAADLDVHYLLNLKGKFRPYPLLGLNFTRYRSKADWMEKPETGLTNKLNYGLGGEYTIHEILTSYLEIKRAPYFGDIQFSLGLLFSL